MSLSIQILYSSCCPFYEESVETIKRLGSELNRDVEIEMILIDDMDKAIEHSFIGSPSVRINGLDIDPRVRRPPAVGLT